MTRRGKLKIQHTGNADRMQARLCGLSLLIAALVATLLTLPLPARAQGKPSFQINTYIIDAEIDPATHHLTVTAQVNFTALDNLDTIVFQLHNALKVNRVTDVNRAPMTGERGQNSTIRVSPKTPMTQG